MGMKENHSFKEMYLKNLDIQDLMKLNTNILGKLYSRNNDIFIFKVARGSCLYNEQYKLLESIQDGTAMNSDQVFKLKKPIIDQPLLILSFSKNHPATHPASHPATQPASHPLDFPNRHIWTF